MPSKVETRAEQLMSEILSGTDFELIDVEFVKEKEWYLRIFVDKPAGVDLEDCQMLSEKLGSRLDKESVIDGSYILEVSSPGLDRVLKKDRDFVRESGKTVDVTLYAPIEGKKFFTGVLEGRDEKFLRLAETVPLPREKVAHVRLHIDF